MPEISDLSNLDQNYSVLGVGIVGNFSLKLFSNELQLIVYKKR